MRVLTKMIGEDRGTGLVEYGLIVSVISLMSFSAIAILGESTSDAFSEVGEATQAASSSGGGSSEDAPSVPGGGDGSGGATTTTTAPATTTTTTPATTTTTVAPTTTTTAPPATTSTTAGTNGDEGDPGGSTATSTDTGAEFSFWNTSKHGGDGEWTASVTYSNDWAHHQYLTLEVTTTDDKGHTSAITVDSCYVPAGGTATFEQLGNAIRDHKGNVTGVMEIEVAVISVRTLDADGQESVYPQTGDAVTTVGAPAVP